MSDRHRLFFALWPDAGTRQALAVAARHWSRHPVSDANLHMTLVFLGSRDDDALACFTRAAASVESEPFDLELDYLGGWQRSRTQWLGTARAPAALGRLVEALRSALAVCGFQGEARRFVPHVTLSRKEKSPATRAGLAPIEWPVTEFVLAESLPIEGGVRYEIRERWPLR